MLSLWIHNCHLPRSTTVSSHSACKSAWWPSAAQYFTKLDTIAAHPRISPCRGSSWCVSTPSWSGVVVKPYLSKAAFQPGPEQGSQQLSSSSSGVENGCPLWRASDVHRRNKTFSQVTGCDSDGTSQTVPGGSGGSVNSTFLWQETNLSAWPPPPTSRKAIHVLSSLEGPRW